MRYKLLVLDVDGTVIGKNSDRVSDVVIEKINMAISKDVYVSFATARSFNELKIILDQINIPTSNIHTLLTGAKIADGNNNIISSSLISSDTIIKIYEKIVFKDFYINFRRSDERIIDDIKEVRTGDEFSRMSIENIPQSQLQNTLNQIQAIDMGLMISSTKMKDSDLYIIHINNRSSTKQNGIQMIQKILGLTKRETIGIGDSENDLAMFEQVSLRLAMGNAELELKRNSDYILPTVDQDGVAYAIDEYIV